MKYITRWALMRCMRQESLSEHTADTALLAHALCLIARNITHTGADIRPDTVAAAALYHDAPEILTGDMPTPIKYYNPQIRDSYKQVEQVACDKLLHMLPRELQPDYEAALRPADPAVEELVKAADKLSAHIKCLEELKAGNGEFRAAAEQTRQALERMDLPEVKYFCDNFLGSFSLTLDEME